MVIQRWQTLWLLVALILVTVFCFVPMALITNDVPSPVSATFLNPIDVPVLLVVNSVVAVLLFIAIFMYRNTRRQKLVTLLSILMLVVSMVTEALILFGWNSEESRIEWLGSIFLLLGALAFAALAYRGIAHDERLLRSADRLR